MTPLRFQAFTVKANGLADRIITSVEVCAAFDPRTPPNTLPPLQGFQALWDTGASKSVVSRAVSTALGLVPSGTAQVNHAGGTGRSPTYMVNFRLPHQVAIVGLLVTELAQTNREFDVIIGMDVIGLGDFSITNVGGQTWMSFRTPSCVSIDYVDEANRLKFAGVGRNDACPCGKASQGGRPVKFKHCHGR